MPVFAITAGLDFGSYSADYKTRRAVERCIEVISEATRHLRQLGSLISASVDTQQAMSVVPYARVAMQETNGALAKTPTEDFQPSKIKVSAHVNAVFTLQ